MTRKKYFVVGHSDEYGRFIKNQVLVGSIQEADIVIFSGGEDVDPSMYGVSKHPTTHSNLDRDIEEKKIFDSIPSDKLVIGICRGSQLCCALNGGILVQNCKNHGLWNTHGIINKEGETYEITSTHHQMQFPYFMPEKDYDVLFWSSPNRSRIHEGYCSYGSLDKYWEEHNFKEPEIVLYHKEGHPKCLAIQGHPEMMDEENPTVLMLNNLINNLLK